MPSSCTAVVRARPVTRGAARTHPVALGAAVVLTLAGCAAPAPEPSAAADDVAPGFPVTVASCGVEATVPAPPQRIVTIKSSATEMVLALGA
ncbi:putative F420-0 ABC transporter substrate-binding protein, partial [Georgenia sp. 10Sc9-8]|nr:putative F420-0 ABC transporter substrate-binding protein [Georgenia halotolerans]